MTPNFSFEMLETGDGSPTVRMWKPDMPAECMHHSGGALSESIYIYLEALKKAHEFNFPIRILSMGTGLGYNEMLCAAYAIQQGIPKSNFHLTTFESEDFIRQEFVKWQSGQEGEWQYIYQKIARTIAKQFETTPEALRAYLSDIEIRGALDVNTNFEQKFSVILFDLFSSKATPDVWTPETLSNFISRAFMPQCVLSSYASKGDLRRALQAAGFIAEKRAGFFGKRHCTLAIRR